MTWERRYDESGLPATAPELLEANAARLRALGFDDPAKLHPFVFADLCADLSKPRLLLAYQMGLSKTAYAIASVLASGVKHALIVVPTKLVGEWERELRRLGVADEEWQSVADLSSVNRYECPDGHGEVRAFRKIQTRGGRLLDVERPCGECGRPALRRDALRRINLVTFNALKVVPKDSPHADAPKRPAVADAFGRKQKPERAGMRRTLAWELRRRAEYVVVDEAYALANPDALQTKAVFLLKPRRKLLLTGTPVRGYPDNILALLNWLAGGSSDALAPFDPSLESSRGRFLARFGSYVDRRRPDGSSAPRLVPRIKDPEGFQALIAPLMRRRVNTEPEVAAVLRMPSFTIEPESIEIDENLRTIYEGFATDFATWYTAAREEAAQSYREVNHISLLAKLNTLSRLAACPQAIVPSYEGRSAKQRRIIDLVRGAAARGRKTILLSEHVESAEWYAALPDFAALEPQLITGKVSMARAKRSGSSERERRLAAFREGESRLLVATTATLAEGLNLPEASVVLFDSFPWVPSVQQQAWSRVLRPAQKTTPVEIRLVGLAGTIDDYLAAICALKRLAIGEGIDHEQVEIDAEEIPDPNVYATSIVESAGVAGAVYGATAWIERLKAQAAVAPEHEAA
jgi:hypothetical protein